MKSIFKKIFIAITIFIFSSAKAEITLIDLPGLSKLTTSEYTHLSPDKGLLALHSGLIASIRFNGDYGPEDETFLPHTQLTEEQLETDSPQDEVTQLIQWLYPSPAGGQLTANQTDSLEGSLNAKTIGAIIGFLANHRNDKHKLAALIFKMQYRDIYQNIFDKLTLKLVNESIAKNAKVNEIKDRKMAFGNLIKSAKDAEERNRLIKGANACKEEIKDIKKDLREHLKPDQDELDSAIRKLKKYKPCLNLASMLITAHQQCNTTDDYPKYTVEWSLLAYACIKSNKKDELLDLVAAMGKPFSNILTNEQGLYTKPENWHVKYTVNDYEHITNKIKKESSQAQLTDLLNTDIDRFNFITLGYHVYENALPLINQRQSSFKDNTYPDCGEVFVWNILNLLIFDRENRKFDTKFLSKVAPQADAKIIAFYNKLKVDNMLTMRNEWSQIVSNRANKKIQYRHKCDQGSYEIDAGLSNALTVIADLLNDDKLKTIIENCSTPDAQEAEKLMTRLCEIFSISDKTYTWCVKETRKQKIDDNKNVTIVLSENDTRKYRFKITPGHFEIEIDAEDSTQDWRQIASPDFNRSLSESEQSLLLPFFAHHNDFETLSEHEKSILFYTSLPMTLENFGVKLNALFPKEELDCKTQDILVRLINTHSLEDPEITRTVLRLLLPYTQFTTRLHNIYTKAWSYFDNDPQLHLHSIIWDSPSPALIEEIIDRARDKKKLARKISKLESISNTNDYYSGDYSHYEGLFALLKYMPDKELPTLLKTTWCGFFPIIDALIHSENSKIGVTKEILRIVPKKHHKMLFSKTDGSNTLIQMIEKNRISELEEFIISLAPEQIKKLVTPLKGNDEDNYLNPRGTSPLTAGIKSKNLEALKCLISLMTEECIVILFNLEENNPSYNPYHNPWNNVYPHLHCEMEKVVQLLPQEYQDRVNKSKPQQP